MTYTVLNAFEYLILFAGLDQTRTTSSVLEITVSSNQIYNMASQCHIMIGHDVQTLNQRILTSSFEDIVHP